MPSGTLLSGVLGPGAPLWALLPGVPASLWLGSCPGSPSGKGRWAWPPSRLRGNEGHGCQGLWFVGSTSPLLPCPRADYYSPSMLGLKTDQEVLGELVRTKLPAVAALMDSHGLLWTLVVSRWFICLFVDVLPVEVRAPGSDWGRLGGHALTRCLFLCRPCFASGIVCSTRAPRSSSGWR